MSNGNFRKKVVLRVSKNESESEYEYEYEYECTNSKLSLRIFIDTYEQKPRIII